ncbi:hypothetical protein MLD38_024754 [Melastoma candidum]|uniref:Uncharacterized protein n=1 Tax=Melastoma candidum TaxID=119954 RepID=A0ACB9NUV8_9MYRT|nr:hypothetical protein MLD38_024754 [Melastoma candidum]
MGCRVRAASGTGEGWSGPLTAGRRWWRSLAGRFEVAGKQVAVGGSGRRDEDGLFAASLREIRKASWAADFEITGDGSLLRDLGAGRWFRRFAAADAQRRRRGADLERGIVGKCRRGLSLGWFLDLRRTEVRACAGSPLWLVVSANCTAVVGSERAHRRRDCCRSSSPPVIGLALGLAARRGTTLGTCCEDGCEELEPEKGSGELSGGYPSLRALDRERAGEMVSPLLASWGGGRREASGSCLSGDVGKMFEHGC